MKQTEKSTGNRKDPPAITSEAREQQLMAKAERLAEKKLEDGTASPQIIVHYLRLASEREKRRQQEELLKADIELKKAKVEAIRSAAKIEELYNEGMKLFRMYSGTEDVVDEDV